MIKYNAEVPPSLQPFAPAEEDAGAATNVQAEAA